MSGNQDQELRSLVSLLPSIRRARFWRLYAEDGRRFLDLWAQGGRGILGARGDALGRVMKENVDRGLSAPLPSVWRGRLEKALLAWKPDYAAVRFFLSEERARAAFDASRSAFEALGGAETPSGIERKRSLGIERPMGEYLDSAEYAGASTDRGEAGKAHTALAILPCPAAWSPAVLLFRDPAEAERIESDLVPPQMLAVGTRSLAELSKFSSRVGEKHWRRADRRIAGLFRRAGPWLIPAYPEERHASIFRACLERGLLISPDYALPSLLPGDFDDGELKPLGELRP